jgi:PAS domain S-box-containing protein
MTEKENMVDQRYRVLVDLAVDGILQGSTEGIIIDVNECMCTIAGMTREDFIGKHISELPFTRESIEKTPFRFDLLTKGEIVISERSLIRPDGNMITIEMRTKMMPDGTYQSIYRDITERIKAETRIRTLLEEKEILLREVHHRIKNNMETIRSLLSLQANSTAEPAAAAALIDAGSRVQSMMILYDKLYQNPDIRDISINNYLSTLADEIVKNYPGSSSVVVEKNIEDFIINAKKVQTIGLIVNELISNSMKYAFRDKKDKKITLTIKLKGKDAELSVMDNGVGIPESVDFKNSKGLGLKLIDLMVQQINASIEIKRDNGTSVILKFEK